MDLAPAGRAAGSDDVAAGGGRAGALARWELGRGGGDGARGGAVGPTRECADDGQEPLLAARATRGREIFHGGGVAGDLGGAGAERGRGAIAAAF